MACDLISWLRSKTLVLARLRALQEENGRVPALTVIRAVLTRWTAHYLAFRRLLELQPTLRALVSHDALLPNDQKVICPSGSTAANKRKAREMVEIIDNTSFWHSLARCETFYFRTAVNVSLLYF